MWHHSDLMQQLHNSGALDSGPKTEKQQQVRWAFLCSSVSATGSQMNIAKLLSIVYHACRAVMEGGGCWRVQSTQDIHQGENWGNCAILDAQEVFRNVLDSSYTKKSLSASAILQIHPAYECWFFLQLFAPMHAACGAQVCFHSPRTKLHTDVGGVDL